MTSKQRAKLKAMASKSESIFQIGKGGITDNQIGALAQALQKRELIKITVLRNSEAGAAALMEQLCGALHAEPVALIGNKIVLYKYSSLKTIEHIEF